METQTSATDAMIEAMMRTGAHLGYGRTRRHASVRRYIFGTKNGVDIIDLTETAAQLKRARERLLELGKSGKTVLFVGTKPEIRELVKDAATAIGMPHVTGRWVGGVLTNWPEIKKRTARLKELSDNFAKGEMEKYTKKERLLFERELGKLQDEFGGIVGLEALPAALVVVDPREESIAVAEAKKMNIETIAVMNSDCDVAAVTYPILANDAALESVTFFLAQLTEAYQEGRKQSA